MKEERTIGSCTIIYRHTIDLKNQSSDVQLQHTAIHCNTPLFLCTLQHTATHYIRRIGREWEGERGTEREKERGQQREKGRVREGNREREREKAREKERE